VGSWTATTSLGVGADPSGGATNPFGSDSSNQSSSPSMSYGDASNPSGTYHTRDLGLPGTWSWREARISGRQARLDHFRQYGSFGGGLDDDP
jgi:hypothetical protein